MPATFVCLLASACGDADAPCDEGDSTYQSGQAWTCSDGCNRCRCNDGTVTKTAIGCGHPQGPDAG